MIQLSQLSFWMFSGALGAVGVAATVGVLDQPPNLPGLAKTSLAGEQISGSNSAKKPDEEKVAKLAVKPQSEPAKKKPAVTPPAIVPSFDLLRVEKDGSTLIAGHAQPDSTIEIFDGVIIVATTEAGSNGDFVAILEKPLSPGDHQLGIRSTGKDSKILVSAETGLVSVPIEQDGELLAMVMKPGEASRVIQKPAASKPAENIKTATLAPATSTAKPAEKVVETTNTAPESKIEVALETPVIAEPNSPVVAKNETESVTKPAVKVVEQAVAKVEPAKEAALIKETEATKELQVAALVASKKVEATPINKPAARVEPEKTPTIIVEAVEVDGSIMFIAGAAEPGRRVAVYVDNKLVGFADGSREGRFLLEVERKLSRGEHLVRADIYDAKGVAVASRAEVPLIHEPEEPAVVVAKVEKAEKPQKVADKKIEPVEKKVQVAKVEPASPAAPVVESAKEIVASTVPLAPVVNEAANATEKLVEKAPEKPKKTEEVQIVIAKPIAMKPEISPAVTEKTQPEKPVETKVVENAQPATPPAKTLEKSAATKLAKTIAKATSAAVVHAPAKETKTATQPAPELKKEAKLVASAAPNSTPARKVLRTGSSVIIRRGDSLWRISYRTYGRGIRYSTIYQANLSQLRSPHRIYPGQILKVPKKKFKQQG